MLDPAQAMAMLASSTSTPEALHTHPDNEPPIIIPGPRVEDIHHAGKRALWVFFALMLASSIVGAWMSWNIAMKKRALHTIMTLVLLTASISYFGMATGQAVTWVRDTYHQGEAGYSSKVTFRQVFWARYADWAITTPLLLSSLGHLSGMAGGHIVMMIAADLIMFLSGLFAAMSHTETQHWGWYAIACISYIFVIWHLAINGRVSAVHSRSDRVQKLAGSLTVYILLLWAVYLIIWAVGRGTALISVDGEVIAYGVLDLLAKPVFGLVLLRSHDVVDDSSLEVGGFWAGGADAEGRITLGGEDGA